ncbi:DUF5986 family protein [Bacillus atrophaeus]|uniref:DUF5986 family protein n=1 Tax=Bacillus atrophaeus TaxID=1452 RepID=UPI002281F3F3|nr:DUF5986 family protein [Bacillus atrophaeus]MCY8523201.1 DUF5986 family protein [Bacillus atrophaeus]MCY8525853.1 DUF5986 family protein [Bacillus atrophaeus]MCY8959516.1 DUF5986 family protein [Bacillus atrophaeus]MCY8963223.1 DUF5986 family protein [Bacillus atrophaeus]MCY9437693.1 DUF5986 family protein [Bacillus atrophaeus]
MLLDETNVPMSDNYKTLIIKSVADAFSKDIKAFKADYDLETYNSENFLKWDFINTNLVNALSFGDFQCSKVKRGPWRFVLIFDKNSGNLYSLMRQERFYEIQEKTNREKIHYLDALASINDFVEAIQESFRQINLFDIDGQLWREEAEKILSELIQNIDGEVKCFTLLTFSNNKSEITDFSALTLTPSLGIAYEESWNDFIPAEYDLGDNEIVMQDDNEDDDIDLILRDVEETDNHENDIQLRKTEKEKDNTD